MIPDNYNYSDMLYALARAANARKILETGGGPQGTSGQAFARALSECGGELWTVDIVEGRPPKHTIESVPAQVKWNVVVGDSLKVDLVQFGTGFDLLYIDGDHGGEHAWGDFEHFAPLVRPGGLVVWDDYNPPDKDGIKHAVEKAIALVGYSGMRFPYNHEDGNSHYALWLPATWKGI